MGLSVEKRSQAGASGAALGTSDNLATLMAAVPGVQEPYLYLAALAVFFVHFDDGGFAAVNKSVGWRVLLNGGGGEGMRSPYKMVPMLVTSAHVFSWYTVWHYSQGHSARLVLRLHSPRLLDRAHNVYCPVATRAELRRGDQGTKASAVAVVL